MNTHDLIGRSPRLRALLEEVELVALSDCAVLLQGETGTGKEVIARFIHGASNRRSNPFVAVNCAAIPAELLEVIFSAMSAAPLQVPFPKRWDGFRRPIVARCFWTKSGICRYGSSRNFCARYRGGNLNAWEAVVL